MPPSCRVPRVADVSLSGVLRVVAGLVAAVVALVLVAYLAVNLVGMARASALRDRLSGQLTERLAAEVPAARLRSERTVRAIGREPAHRWLEQDCAFTTDEGGWLVLNHRQVCALRAVHAWPATSAAYARRVVRRADGLRGVRDYPTGDCVPVAAGTLGRAWFVRPSAEDERWVGCLAAYGATAEPIDGRRTELDPERGWLVVVAEQPLLDADLGCARWSVLFCDNPFGDDLAWGRAPD